MKFNFLICLILLFPYCLISQPAEDNYSEISKTIVKKSLTDRKGYELLRDLCAMGPRLSGDPNLPRVIDWCSQTLESVGCDTVWRQRVMSPHWERGEVESLVMNGIKNPQLAIAALGGSIGTPLSGITAEILEVHSFEELHDKSNLARGKIIFFNRPFENGTLHTFEGYGGAVLQRTKGAVEAAQVGGVAALVRSVTSATDNQPHTGVMYYEDGITQVPAAAVGVIDADRLSRTLRDNPRQSVTLKLSCQNFPQKESFNVIGEIRGNEFPDEVIVVGGHLDAWDVGDGAHDNGAGCMQSVEVLYLLKSLDRKPRRTVRCVLFMDEEQHQTGAKAYGQYAASTGETHLAAIESDAGAFSPRGFLVDADSLVIKRINSWLPYLNLSGIEWVNRGGSGADISQIKNAKALIGYRPDGQRYFDYHHSANDVFRSVHPREMELGSAAMTILVYLISEEGLNIDSPLKK